MKIKVANRVFDGTNEEGNKLMAQASEFVKCGIYALEHKGAGYIELTNIPCSVTQIKRLTRAYKSRGIKVYANRG